MTRNMVTQERDLLSSSFMMKQVGALAHTFASQPTIEDRVSAFKLYWTCKEAFMKYTGLGLSLGLNAFELVLTELDQEATRVWRRLPLKVFIREKLSLGDIRLLPGRQEVDFWLCNQNSEYWITLCAPSRPSKICSKEIVL